jgi:hypothetical protein
VPGEKKGPEHHCSLQRYRRVYRHASIIARVRMFMLLLDEEAHHGHTPIHLLVQAERMSRTSRTMGESIKGIQLSRLPRGEQSTMRRLV